MAPLVLTDLDDTLFQTLPKCPPDHAGLRRMSVLADGTPSGFATMMQQHLLQWLSVGQVVPVTARGRDVLARVDIPGAPAICSNGGCIIEEGGALDLAWHSRLQDLAGKTEPVDEVYRRITGALCAVRFRHWIVIENGLQLYIVIKSNEQDHAALAALEVEVSTEVPQGWRCHRNGNNLAYLPPWLSKRHAVRHFIERSRAEWPDRPIIGVGDSLSDVGFMDLCDLAAVPTQSQLWTQITDGSKWIE